MVIAQDVRTTTRRRPTVLLVAGVAAAVFVLVIARWLTTPFDDWVPLAHHQDLPVEINVDDLPDAAHYRCSAVLDNNTATATAQATDALTYQDLTRDPCGGLRTQRKMLGALDVTVALAALVGVGLVRRRTTSPAA